MISGLLVALLLNVALWGGAALVVAAVLERHTALDRLLATAVLGFAAILLGLEGLSLAGLMCLGPTAALSAVVALVGTGVWWKKRGGLLAGGPPGDQPDVKGHAARSLESGSGSNSQDGRLSRLFAGAALLVAGWAALYFLVRGLVLPVETVSDAPIYHLPFAIHWWKAGRIDLVPTPFGELAASYFPANGDVWLAWLVIATGSETLAKVGQWPFLLLGGAATFGLARLTGAGSSASVFPAAIWTVAPAVLVFSGVANVDLIFAAFYLVAVYFLVRYARSVEQQKAEATVSLALFALAAGVVLGTKSVGLVFVLLLIPPAVLFLFRSARWTSHFALLLLGLALPCAFWYARNALLTGNPLYPLHVELFGRTVLAGWYDAAIMRTSGYHAPTDHWRLLVDRMTAVLDLRLAWLLPAAIVVGIVSGMRVRGGPRGARLAALLALLAVLHFALYWWVVPYNTQERFLLPALGLALVPLASVLGRWQWVQLPLVLLLVWHLLTPQWFTNLAAPAAGRSAVVRGATILPPRRALPWKWRPRRPEARAEEPLSDLVRFYPAWDFGGALFPTWEALEQASGPEGARVAYAGTNLPYYLFGIGLRNEVRYVNVNAHPDWMPHDYHLARLRAGRAELADDPWPDWYRENADYDAWLANLRAADIELLFVARENRHGRPETADGLPPFPIELQWARAHPEVFQLVGPAAAPGQAEPWAWLYRLKKTDE